MKCFFFLFTSFALLVSNVASLSIHVSPQANANSSTLVFWTRSDEDPVGHFQFDLRFFQNDADAGLALANINMDEDPDFGSATVTFPSTGSFVLKAVTGNTNIGTSNTINIFPPIASTSASSTATGTSGPSSQSSTATATSTSGASASTTVAVSTTTSASASTSVSSSTSTSSSSSSTPPSSSSTATPTFPPLARLIKHPNLPALVGGIIGSLAGLALLVTLAIFLHRRRTTIRRRLTFHRDMMVQRRLSRAPTLPPLDPRASCASFAHDVEQGLPDPAGGGGSSEGESTETLVGPRLMLGTGHIVPSPKGPRAAAKRIATITTQRSTGSPLSSPRLAALVPTASTASSSSPAPVRTQRQQELADRTAMLRRQMADLQLELDRISLRSATTTTSGSMPLASPMTTTSGMSAPNGRAAEIRVILDDMQRQMVWLKEQENAPWAMHLTDVLPPGHARYLRP